jgi:hypothetical protein
MYAALSLRRAPIWRWVRSASTRHRLSSLGVGMSRAPQFGQYASDAAWRVLIRVFLAGRSTKQKAGNVARPLRGYFWTLISRPPDRSRSMTIFAFRLSGSLGDDALSFGHGTRSTLLGRRERFNFMKCMTCDTPELSDDEFDSHARHFHNQLSGDELRKMFKELSEELAAEETELRKTK